jgi:hypothetical protein
MDLRDNVQWITALRTSFGFAFFELFLIQDYASHGPSSQRAVDQRTLHFVQ